MNNHALLFSLVAGASITFLIVLGVLMVYLPFRTEKSLRRMCKTRHALAHDEWIQQFYPNYADCSSSIKTILAAIADAYRVESARLRPCDILRNNGLINPVIVDDSFGQLLLRLAGDLDVDISSLTQISRATVNTVISEFVSCIHEKQSEKT